MKKIGILMFWKEKTKGRYYTVSTDIYKRLEELDVMPIMIPNGAKNFKSIIKECSGLLIPGGPDLCPDLYGAPHKGAKEYSKEQDMLSLEAVYQAHKIKIPIFGICRGMQMINVFFGGTLIQDIKTYAKHHQYNRRYEEVHTVAIQKNTLLYAAFKKEKLGVNSLHHQAIKVLGKGLEVSAFDDEDSRIIEGVENKEKQIYGVQWHPEKFPHHNDIFAHAFDLKKKKKSSI